MNSKRQASALIDLASHGIDPRELMEGAIKEINEGSGGPFPIGSKVVINHPWAGPSVSGEPISISQGDVVSIVMPNLGEHGQDKMVLLSDGFTKAIIPYNIIGEEYVREEEVDDVGPDGYKVPNTIGSASVVAGKAQGGPLPSNPNQPKGSKTPTVVPSAFVGQGKPKDEPEAQMVGSSTPLVSPSVALESLDPAGALKYAIYAELNNMLEGAPESVLRRIVELKNTIHRVDDDAAYVEIFEMMFGDRQYKLEDLENIFVDIPIYEGDDEEEPDDNDFADMTPEERKKYVRKHRRKYREQDDNDEVEPDEDDLADMTPEERKKYMKKFSRKYREQDDTDDTDDTDDADLSDMTPEERKKYIKKHRRKYREQDDTDDMPNAEELGAMAPEERRKYIRSYRKRYRGKYCDMPDQAKKMVMKYGSNLAKKTVANEADDGEDDKNDEVLAAMKAMKKFRDKKLRRKN